MNVQDIVGERLLESRQLDRIYRAVLVQEPGGPSETEIEASRLKVVHRAA
jgi:hypothetical protein